MAKLNAIGDVVRNVTRTAESKKRAAEERKTRFKIRAGMLTPWYLFGFATIVLAFGEYRVWDYVMAMTGRPAMAWGTLLATGLGAEAFFFAWKYNLANSFQRTISIFMMAVNFMVATYIGFGDYLVDSSGNTFGASASTISLILATVLALDVVVSIAYFLSDEQVKKQRAASRLAEEMEERSRSALLVGNLLEKAGGVLEVYNKLSSQYGEDNLEAMMNILGDGNGEDDTMVKKLQGTKQTNHALPAATYPNLNRGNGNGNKNPARPREAEKVMVPSKSPYTQTEFDFEDLDLGDLPKV